MVTVYKALARFIRMRAFLEATMQRNVFGSVVTALVSVSIMVTAMRTSAAPLIAVGPNIQVSNDGDAAHVEVMAAANPVNPLNILGTSITFLKPGSDIMTKTYASIDGGYTWTDAVTPQIFARGSADPQVAFGPNGTAYYVSLVNVTLKNVPHDQMMLYRSSDGGRSWSIPFNFGYRTKLGSFDHEQVVIDQSASRNRGRIYIGILYGPYPDYNVGVVHSADGGRSFQGPVLAASGHKKIGINDANPLVLSDGALILPYQDFEFETKKAKKSTYSTIWTVESDDGGRTFSSSRRAERQYTGSYEAMMARSRAGRFDEQTFADFADDPSTGPRRDRIYMVWSDRRSGNTKAWFAYSDTRGRSWSASKFVDPDTPRWASQYQPEVVVNRDGVVGIAWLDTRDSYRQDRYREYFTASLDGGRTFLRSTPVSSMASFPQGPGNARLIPLENDRATPLLGLRFMSAFTRYPAGGDYMGITTDLNGAFHPMWADSRTGTFQLFTAKVQVLPKLPSVSRKIPADITKKVAVTFGTISFNEAEKVYTIPVQIRNISKQTLYGPVALTVEKTIDPYDIQYDRVDPKNSFSILNATNGKQAVGAVFDYSRALGTLSVLEPGALSEAIVWRVHMGPTTQPYFGVRVRGYVTQ